MPSGLPFRLALLLALFGLACGGVASPCASGPTMGNGSSPTGADEFWVSGTPVYTQGEGFMREFYIANTPAGPWTYETRTRTLEVPDSIELVPGKLHRLHARDVAYDPRLADAPRSRLVVEALLETRDGIPTVLHPGGGAGGFALEDAAMFTREEPVDTAGPYILRNRPSIEVHLDTVLQAQIGETVVREGQSIEAIADALGEHHGPCQRFADAETVTFRCPGYEIEQGGSSTTEGVILRIVARSPAAANVDSSQLRWVRGAPTFDPAAGEGALYYISESAEGPWERVRLEGNVDALDQSLLNHTLVTETATPGLLHVHGVSGTQAGGPPIVVTPGVGIEGILLSDVAPCEGEVTRTFVDYGPFRTQCFGAVQVLMNSVGEVQVGDATLRYNANNDRLVDTFAEELGNCERGTALGGPAFRCEGINLLANPGGGVSIAAVPFGGS